MPKKEVDLVAKIYTLKVVLAESEPVIWRRLQIPGQATLRGLHLALQISMGWTESHMHDFRIGNECYTSIQNDGFAQDQEKDERQFRLFDVLKHKGARFYYTYDFGDDWAHEIVVEDISDWKPGVQYPRCIDGERQCPPEDCGGIGGYYNILEILQNPSDSEYEMYKEWFPSGFVPEHFDVAQVNRVFDRFGELCLAAESEGDFTEPDEEWKSMGYEEPVCRLLTLGYPNQPMDYTIFGIGAEHIPGLIRMVQDMELHHAEQESPLVWAPVHAWRVLAQLRAVEAIEPLAGLLRLVDDESDDWASSELPDVFGEIGPEAIPVLSAYMRDALNGLFARCSAITSISSIAQRHPETRDVCVAELTENLDRFAEHDATLNAILILELVNLDAAESAPVMERAFAADAVDECILGDWEDVRIELGLLQERITKKPRRYGFAHSTNAALTPPGKKQQKDKKKRKNQEKSRRKNRKK